MWHEIERLARDELMTILLTTHYLEEADRLASRAGDRRPRADRRRGHAGRAQERARGRPDPGRARRRRATPPRARRSRASAASATRRSTGRTLHARARDGAAAIPAVLAALDAHGVPAASVTLARPSLDDVYLRHAGRSFDRADAEHDGGGGMSARDPPDLAGQPALPARAAPPARVPRHHPDPADHLAAAVRRAVQGRHRDPRLPRRLLRRLPHARRRRDARRLLGRLDGHGLHRGHQRRRHGPHARLAGVARRPEPGQRRLRDDHDRHPDGADRAARAGARRRTTSTASAAC